MKKLIVSLLTFVLVMTSTTLYSQVHLYKGLYSGMTKEKFYAKAKDQGLVTGKYDDGTPMYTTVISGRRYAIIPHWNDKNQLSALFFGCLDMFTASQYDVNIKQNLVELYRIMEAKYGKPLEDNYYGPSDIPKGGNVTCVYWKTDTTLRVGIGVVDSDNGYFVTLVLLDQKYTSDEPTDTEGF